MTALNKRKRVLVFSTQYLPFVGGAEIAIQEITNRLGVDYEFDVVCARFDSSLPKRERIGNVEVLRVGVGIRLIDKLLSPFLGAMVALREGKKRPYDCYWSMMVSYGSLGGYIANMLSSQPVPIVLTLQEGDPPEYLRSKWFGLLGLSWRFALSRSTAVTVISTYLGELTRSFGYQGSYTLIPNGVDVQRFSVPLSIEKRNEIRKQFGEYRTVLVTTSRLVHKNGIDTVIKAMPLLTEQVVFVIYGSGPDEKKLRALAQTLGVSSRVYFMGQVAYEALPEVLKASDIFIRPSRSEGMGNSFIEAMAAGLPVIGTNEGGITDFLFDVSQSEHAPTGWVIHKESPEDISTAVRTILADTEKMASVTSNAKDFIQQRYEWDHIAKNMNEVFSKTIQKGYTTHI